MKTCAPSASTVGKPGNNKRVIIAGLLAETFIARFKRILGLSISARTFASLATEIKVRCNILNVMAYLGHPDSSIVS